MRKEKLLIWVLMIFLLAVSVQGTTSDDPTDYIGLDFVTRANSVTLGTPDVGSDWYEGVNTNFNITSNKIVGKGTRNVVDETDFSNFTYTSASAVRTAMVTFEQKDAGQMSFFGFGGGVNRQCQWRLFSGDLYYLWSGGQVDSGQNYALNTEYNLTIEMNDTSGQCNWHINASSINYSVTWKNDHASGTIAGAYIGTSLNIESEWDNFRIWNGTIDDIPQASPTNNTNFTITAYDRDTAAVINSFNATLFNASGSYNFGTTTGTINTLILHNSTSLFNISLWATHYINDSYINYNVSTNLVGNLTPYLEVKLFDAYDNGTLDSYNIMANSSSYTPEADNITYIPIRDSMVNLTLNKTNYVVRTIEHNSSNNLEAILWQGILNVFAQSVVNGSSINVFNASLPIKWNSTTTGLSSFYTKASNYELNLTSIGYQDYSGSVSIAALETKNVTINMNPYINFTLYDEITDTYLNMSKLDSADLYIYCPTATLSFSFTNSSLYTPVSCAWDFIKYDLDYNTSVYYRTRIPDEDITSTRLYAVDVTEDVLVQVILNLNDLTGEYSNGTLIVKKYINAERTIIEQNFDIENSVTLYLIKNHLYTLAIRDNENNERNLGYFIPDTAGEKTLTLPEISFNPDTTLGNTLNWDWTNSNSTHIRFIYNDSVIETSIINFNIFNGSNPSQLIYTTSSLNVGYVSFTYLAVGNTSYLSCFNATHSELGIIGECKPYWNGQQVGSFDAYDTDIVKWKWWFSLFFLFFCSLLIGANAVAGLGLTTFFAWMLILWDWFTFGSSMLDYTILSLVTFITIILLIIWSGKK